MICKHEDYHTIDIVLFTLVLVVLNNAYIYSSTKHRWPKMLSVNILPHQKLCNIILAA